MTSGRLVYRLINKMTIFLMVSWYSCSFGLIPRFSPMRGPGNEANAPPDPTIGSKALLIQPALLCYLTLLKASELKANNFSLKRSKLLTCNVQIKVRPYQAC